jgi:pimeloyl-ACP methyl ester carboxylesterase
MRRCGFAEKGRVMSVLEKAVTSSDGTTIAYEQTGHGPAVVLVASSLADRSDMKRLAALLASRFTVINYDRRGRGLSSDTPPYHVQREVEDIGALVDEAGGSAFVFGSSSGAVLALEAAASGVNIGKLALYEPPFRVDRNGPLPPHDLGKDIARLIADNRRGRAVRLFMTQAIGVPSSMVVGMRLMPGVWSKLMGMAHTITYDIAVMGDTQSGNPLPADHWAGVKVPTLVIDGGKSSTAQRNAAQALINVLPNAQRRTLPGQGHAAPVMAPKKLSPLLIEFFAVESVDDE